MLRHGKRLRIFHVYRKKAEGEREAGGGEPGKKAVTKASKKGEERKKKDKKVVKGRKRGRRKGRERGGSVGKGKDSIFQYKSLQLN